MKFVCVFAIVAVALVGAISPSCMKPCTKIYRPVCGFNGDTYKIFNNKCLMEEQSCDDALPWELTTMNRCLARSETSCMKQCTKIYKPVCGFNGETYKIFNNKCLMEEQSCNDALPWELTTMSHCLVKSETSCEKQCTKIFMPVCGFNGETYKIFNNKCLMEEQRCNDALPWELTTINHCLLRSETPCLRMCPRIYFPVCGFNGETYKIFSNDCIMEQQSCMDAAPWTMTTMDNCKVARSADRDCIRACPLNYMPVCGFDGENYRIFGNECDFESVNCFDNNKWQTTFLVDCEAHGLHAY